MAQFDMSTTFMVYILRLMKTLEVKMSHCNLPRGYVIAQQRPRSGLCIFNMAMDGFHVHYILKWRVDSTAKLRQPPMTI